ncbi:hypothetical protein SLS60_004189 [Paraconiothyrium brasiliense]|uniref:Uncharacterized protein n=1 Tax=Paraconiothyrium brasiliense TaxID=300254 RepID=A0ABR3RQS4_9PLEO
MRGLSSTHTSLSQTISAATTDASTGTEDISSTKTVPFNTPSAFPLTTLDPAPTASSPASTPTTAPVDQLETGVKIGISILAGFLGLALIVFFVEACYLRRRRREKALQRAVQEVESGERAERALADLKGSEEIVVLESRVSIVFDDVTDVSDEDGDDDGEETGRGRVRNGLSLPRRGN